MRKLKCIFYVLSLCMSVQAQQFVKTDKSHYKQGDTISLNCNLEDFKKDSVHFASLYLFVENIDTKKRWSLRYPVFDGQLTASIVIDSNLQKGTYAFNFVVRKSFFSIRGSAPDYADTKLNYSMFTKKNESYFDQVQTDKNGNFALRGVLFEDTCYFVFSKPNTSGFTVNVETRLDSAFTPDKVETDFVYVGVTDTLTNVPASTYHSDIESFENMNATLPGVTVKSTQKKKVESFNKEYSTGLFQNPNARIFDGLESNSIAESGDILDFLRSRVAGLQVKAATDGTYLLQWRGPNSFRGGATVDLFLDEFKVDKVTRGLVDPAEIAMVKAYPPPAFLTPGGVNGAIVIYTRRGEYDNSQNKNKFRVFGYTPLESLWK